MNEFPKSTSRIVFLQTHRFYLLLTGTLRKEVQMSPWEKGKDKNDKNNPGKPSGFSSTNTPIAIKATIQHTL